MSAQKEQMGDAKDWKRVLEGVLELLDEALSPLIVIDHAKFVERITILRDVVQSRLSQ